MPAIEVEEIVDTTEQAEEGTETAAEEAHEGNGSAVKGRRKSASSGKATKAKKGTKSALRFPDDYSERTKLNLDKVKELFGYREMAPDEIGEHLFKLGNTRVVFDHNARNRPFDEQCAWKYAQDVLTKNWQYNGEAVIFSDVGNSVSGQKRGAAVVMANWLYDHPQQGKYWREIWGDERPWMDTVIHYGIPENEKVIRSIDNVQTRSFADTLYAEGKCFGSKNPDERAAMCRVLEDAVKVLWLRTWAVRDQYAAYKTQSECSEFVGHHPKLVDAVEHIWGEYGEGKAPTYAKCRQIMPPGVAAALLYLMGASDTPESKYFKEGDSVHDRKEQRRLDFSRWDKACEFWSALCGEFEEAKAVWKEIDEALAHKASPVWKSAIVCKAWDAFKEGEPITRKMVKVKTKVVELRSGVQIVKLDDDFPTVGGIDRGPNPPANAETHVSAEDIAEAQAEIDADKAREREGGVKERKKAARQRRRDERAGRFEADSEDEEIEESEDE